MAIDKYLKDGEWWDQNAPKPAEVPALMCEDLMPHWLYLAVANVGHSVEAVKRRLALRMREKPFEK